MIGRRQNLSDNLSWIIAVPFLMIAFVCGVFIQGTNSILFVPCLFSVMAVVGISLFSGLRDGWFQVRSATVFAVIFFWLYLVLSLLWSTVPYVSTIFTFIFSILPAMFLALVISPYREKLAYVGFYALLFVVCGFAVWALIQFFFFYDIYGPRIRHPMLNPNNLAALFNIFTLPVLGMIMIAGKRSVLFVMFLAFAVLFSAILVTQSRGALLAFTVAFFTLTPFFFAGKPLPWKRMVGVAAIIVLAPVMLFVNAGQTASADMVGHISTVADLENSYSFQNRFLLWASAWEMIKSNFWLGTGLGSFYFYFGKYRNSADISDGFFAHMDSLQFWIEMGVLAPVLFYAVLICVLIRTVKATQIAEGREQKIKVMAPFAGMLALTLHTHVSYHLYMPPILIGMAVLLVLWYVETARVLDKDHNPQPLKVSNSLKTVMAIGLVSVFLVSGGWITRAGAGMHYTGQAVSLLDKGRPQDAEPFIEKALFWAPPSHSKPYELAARYRSDLMRQQILSKEKNPDRILFEESEHFFTEARMRNPVSTSIWDYQARLYYFAHGVFIDDGRQRAIDLLRQAVNFFPVALGSRIRLANILVLEGDLEGAWAVLVDGLDKPRYKGMIEVDYYKAMAMVQAKRGNKEQAQKLINEANRLKKAYERRK